MPFFWIDSQEISLQLIATELFQFICPMALLHQASSGVPWNSPELARIHSVKNLQQRKCATSFKLAHDFVDYATNPETILDADA